MKKCVLIYDDDQEILFLCKIILEKYYRVETLFQCKDIIADIEQIKPDFILIDLWIPVLGGKKAITLVKDNPLTRSIPVFIFSANADIEKICIETNANGYISKPFDVASLIEIIGRHIL